MQSTKINKLIFGLFILAICCFGYYCLQTQAKTDKVIELVQKYQVNGISIDSRIENSAGMSTGIFWRKEKISKYRYYVYAAISKREYIFEVLTLEQTVLPINPNAKRLMGY